MVPHNARNRVRPTLPNTTSKIGGYTDVQRTVASACKDVHAGAFLHHPVKQRPWVPSPDDRSWRVVPGIAGTTDTTTTRCRRRQTMPVQRFAPMTKNFATF